MMEMIASEMNAHRDVMEKTIENLQNHIYTVCIIVTEAIKKDKKILIFGNEGSAFIAQYLAVKLRGHHQTQTLRINGIALSVDDSTLTAIDNDYDMVFDKQVETLAKEGDLLIGISTSGNSKNVLRALSLGSNMGCKTIGLSGGGGGAMGEFCDISLIVPSDDAPRIHEMHMLIANIIDQASKIQD